jgi:hypothetical protein
MLNFRALQCFINSKSLAVMMAIPFTFWGDQFFSTLIFGIGFVHFFLSSYFSTTQLKNLLQSFGGRTIFLLCLMSALIPVFYFSKIFTVLFFGLHFALSDAYLRQNGDSLSLGGSVLFSKFLVEMVAFSMVSFHTFMIHPNEGIWVTVLLVLLIFLFSLLALQRHGSPIGWVVKNMERQIETVMITVFLIYFVKISDLQGFLLLGFVHYKVWFLYPWMRANGKFNVSVNRQLTAHMLGLALVLPIAFLVSYKMPHGFGAIRMLFLTWTYYHVCISLVTSKANPVWLVRCFGTNLRAT